MIKGASASCQDTASYCVALQHYHCVSGSQGPLLRHPHFIVTRLVSNDGGLKANQTPPVKVNNMLQNLMQYSTVYLLDILTLYMYMYFVYTMYTVND